MKIIYPMNCPICKSETAIAKNLSQNYIKDCLSEYYNSIAVPADVINTDYSLNFCKNCTFEFANPQVPGNDSFYSWITKQPGYYPSFRWEYGIVASLILSNKEEINVIDIGCGSGKFLKKMAGNKKITLKGIDTTQSSVKLCRDNGLDVSCVYLQDIVNDHINYFDFVTSFHVLEHVPNPFQFVSEMKSILKPGGSIFLSTPYSPMSFESDWFDPLNNPPHHMGRWNEKSYKKLAELLNMKIEFLFPPALSTLKRTYLTFKYKNNIKVNTARTLKFVLLKLRQVIEIYKNQIKREKLSNGKYAPDLVLVRLVKI